MIMDRVMRTIFFVCFLLGVIQTCKAQDTMRIHFKNGGHSDVAIEQVDSITFVKGGETPAAEVSLIGSCFGEVRNKGIMSC